MSLNTQLKAFKRDVEAGAPPGVLDAFRRAVMALHQSDILENALKAGERMPGFTLPDTQGRAVSLAGLLLCGPVVLRPGFCSGYSVTKFSTKLLNQCKNPV